MTTRSDVAIVTARLAHTDRRALSEAWYSALHVAPEAAPMPPSSHGRAGAGPVWDAHASYAAPATSPPNALGTRASSRNVRTATIVATPERRRPATACARSFERAIVTLARRPQPPVARTIVLEGGRVRLLMRSDERAVRIVAVCSDAQRAGVERALAHARFALAARGAHVA